MKMAVLRIYAELNDFLPAERRQAPFSRAFGPGTSVKDLIEGAGVPHTEVDLILANGVPVDFSYLVRDGDRISAYPVFESLDIGPIARLRPRPLREPRFILDTHLGRLARYLRMLGFDALYRNDYRDDELARVSAVGQRILLTRDAGLLKRAVVTRGYWVRETDVRRQLAEVVVRFDLAASVAPFQRCLRCNGRLEPVEKEVVAGRLPPMVRLQHREFQRCPDCDRIYWKGSHYRRMRQWVDLMLARNLTA
ncbi:MAG TPA: Mut7-C RNAse domain-containing protein [Verrucomicrobiae bacterium]|nr:Mut7-C RNAse domain-containing protein [Verrucomicrobiae bacterium]